MSYDMMTSQAVVFYDITGFSHSSLHKNFWEEQKIFYFTSIIHQWLLYMSDLKDNILLQTTEQVNKYLGDMPCDVNNKVGDRKFCHSSFKWHHMWCHTRQNAVKSSCDIMSTESWVPSHEYRVMDLNTATRWYTCTIK